MSNSDEEESFSGSRWEQLRKGSALLCEKCHEKVSPNDQVVACRMAPSCAINANDVYHLGGCPKILCRGCAASDDHPFRPCQCFTLGDHENILWCPDCIKGFRKCNACRGLLCQYCQVDSAKNYGLLCQQCSWAMTELLGNVPEGVAVAYPPWPKYVIPDTIQTAVRMLHDEVKKKTGESVTDVDDDAKPPARGPTARSDADEESQQYMYVLLHKEGGPYRDSEANVVGVYSNHALAVSGAKAKFESLSAGCFEDGRWRKPEIFEKVVDNTLNMKSDDSGILLRQEDRDGGWTEISLQKTPLDDRAESKTGEEKRGIKRYRLGISHS